MEKISQETLHTKIAKLYRTRSSTDKAIRILTAITERETSRKEEILLDIVKVLNDEAEDLMTGVSALFSLAAKVGAVSADRLGELIKTDPAVILAFAEEVEPIEQFDPRSIQ